MSNQPEAWLSGPVPGVPPVLQPVAHALVQMRREVAPLLADFPDALLWQRPAGVASVGFHLQHLTGVIDRLFTYARGESLSDEQRTWLLGEGSPPASEAAQPHALQERPSAHVAGPARVNSPRNPDPAASSHAAGPARVNSPRNPDPAASSHASQSGVARMSTASGPTRANPQTEHLIALLSDQVDRALDQLRAIPPDSILEPRAVGRKRLPSNVLGLLFHAAEHAQRHAGQLMVTCRVLLHAENS